MCMLIQYLNFYGYFCFSFFYCSIGCLSMIVWTPAVLDVLYACVLHFCVCTCSGQLSMFHMEKHSSNTLIIIIIIIMEVQCLNFKKRPNPL